jgi:hypothetical protein
MSIRQNNNLLDPLDGQERLSIRATQREAVITGVQEYGFVPDNALMLFAPWFR